MPAYMPVNAMSISTGSMQERETETESKCVDEI
jgi:hypothetical protein